MNADRAAWAALPKQPRRYLLRDRWADFRVGRADGRRHIPELEPTETTGYPPGNVDGPQLPGYPEPVTPYQAALRNARNRELAEEFERYGIDSARLHQELQAAQARRESLACDMEFASANWDKVCDPLTPQELNRRGLAEQDEREWPPEMLQERRRRAHRLVQREAEELMRRATAGLRVAEVTVEHAHLALEDRFRTAQAAGWQIVHHYGQREASYLGVLARAHKKNGPALVQMLDLGERGLPEWLLRTKGEEERS